MKYPKIIATIGPASKDFDMLRVMDTNGMDIARINTKYGSAKQHEEIIANLKRIHCKILIDIKGTAKLPWVKQQKFDYLAVSYAESASQINKIKKLLDKKSVKIIAKIENKKGIKNVKGILEASDGMMVARGDLGDNVKLERLPIFQKQLLKECRAHKKFTITATEMLLSMTKNFRPTRAEVTDVANAILDGSDAVMLSEETAIGKHPAHVVKTMDNIIKETVRAKNKKLI